MLVLHIPHDSIVIPDLSAYLASRETIQEQLLLLTDWYTKELFTVAPGSLDVQAVISPVSRLFCDMERLENDESEPMSQRGMGVCYESTTDGKPLRRLTAVAKRAIIDEYYRPHHSLFTSFVENSLKQNDFCLIVDCHSFPSKALPSDLDQTPNRPAICVGTDPFHTPEPLSAFVVEFFQTRNLSVKENSPYAGTIVPLQYLNKDRRVLSVMLEINRNLYMNEVTGSKSQSFENIKVMIGEFLNQLQEVYLATLQLQRV